MFVNFFFCSVLSYFSIYGIRASGSRGLNLSLCVIPMFLYHRLVTVVSCSEKLSWFVDAHQLFEKIPKRSSLFDLIMSLLIGEFKVLDQ